MWRTADRFVKVVLFYSSFAWGFFPNRRCRVDCWCLPLWEENSTVLYKQSILLLEQPWFWGLRSLSDAGRAFWPGRCRTYTVVQNGFVKAHEETPEEYVPTQSDVYLPVYSKFRTLRKGTDMLFLRTTVGDKTSLFSAVRILRYGKKPIPQFMCASGKHTGRDPVRNFQSCVHVNCMRVSLLRTQDLSIG